MQKYLEISLKPEIALDKTELEKFISEKTKWKDFKYRIEKQSIDARKKDIKVNLKIRVYKDEEIPTTIISDLNYQSVKGTKKEAVIIGAGPAGLFAALRLIQLGIKPIIFERGKDVQARRRDLAKINRDHIVNPNSNYCFGEGGAGTYSDGKLYTRSKKRGSIQRILEILVQNGANEKILYDAHPHIGTNKLPEVIKSIREKILEFGGEVHFNTLIQDFKIEKNKIVGLVDQNNSTHNCEILILATGHSARDIYFLLDKKNIAIKAKPFALGVRIEHPQSFIDSCQYSRSERGVLPPAAYSLVSQCTYENEERGVFSFCMCPGGFIVPASTEPREIVVNGMSPSKRDSPFANSGIVVAIKEKDWQEFADFGDLAGLKFQESIEKKAWEAVNSEENSLVAPAQKIPDFLNGKLSQTLNETSYQPGIKPAQFKDFLPKFISESLKQGLYQFNKKIRNYSQNHGQLIGIESRTSSPVRIPRDDEKLNHPEIINLFPCGEGAGYAGGIVSAAMDGERCAEAIYQNIKRNDF